jgi:CDP-diacylglycerol--glycerol-3-phosphate 3-phosphatidyltransferase
MIPWALVATRVLLTPVAVAIAWAGWPRWLWLAQGAVAALSDIYDGKLARRWGVVSSELRQSDSIADTIYAIGVAISFWLAEPEILKEHIWGIAIVLGLEAVRYPLDWYRFGRGASYHAFSARLFGVALIPVCFIIMGFGYVGPFLWLALAIGLYSEIEGIVMSLVLPRWTHDVRDVSVAWEIRKAARLETDREVAE